MPITNNTMVRIEDRQLYGGQEIINAYHFVLDSTSLNPNLALLAAAFEVAYVDAILVAQVDDLSHEVIHIKTVNDNILELTLPVNKLGARAAIPAGPAFVAAGYTLSRTTTDVRNGGKRLAGVSDDDTGDIDFNPAGAVIWSALASVFTTPLVTADGTWTPVIYSIDPLIIFPNFRFTYISAGVFLPSIRSQVSRRKKTA